MQACVLSSIDGILGAVQQHSCSCLKTQCNESKSHTDQKHLLLRICHCIQHPGTKMTLLETASPVKQQRPCTPSSPSTVPFPVCLSGMQPAVSWRYTDVQGERPVSVNLNLSQQFYCKSRYHTVHNNLLVSWHDHLIMFARNH